MTPVNGDFDDLLRRALHAAADGIEPADGGLARIRQRIRAPWLVRQTSLVFTECADVLLLIGIRLGPWATRAAAATARASSRVPGMARISAAFRPRRRGPAHAGPARVSASLGWLRPAAVIAAAALIVVAGLVGLGQLHQNLVLSLFGGNSNPSTAGPGAIGGGGHGTTPAGSSVPGLNAKGKPASPHRPSPGASCPPAASPAPAADPSPSPSGSPTTTPTSVPSGGIPLPAITSTTTTPLPLITISATPGRPTGVVSSTPTHCGGSTHRTATPKPSATATP